MSTGNKRTLTISIGKENQYKTENITKGNIDNSFFAEQYRESLKAIDAYLGHLPKCTSGKCNKDSFGEDKPNNIIAFVGDRGSGKTSCMESVAKYLKENNKELEEYKEICSRRFYAFDMIEPAFFDDEHNVVSLVIASLYKDFCKESGNLYRNHEKKLSVAKCFSKVQEELECMVGKAPEMVDNFDKLANLANAVSLKQDIEELIGEFLDFMEYKDGILLLHIDDIDLNTQCADKMTESIRKYLILPNVLVLLSVKIEQLEKVKQLAYVNEYKSLLDREKKTGFTHENIKDMVDKFVTKLLPRVQRIHMPGLSFLNKDSLSIVDKDKELHFFEDKEEAIPALIENRTGLLFYNKKSENNRIIPRNLREYCQLIRLLCDMSVEKNSKWDNTKILVSYIFDEWAEKQLDTDRYNAIKELFEETKDFNYNKIAVAVLYRVFKDTIDGWREENDERFIEAISIIDKYNNPQKITLGDVFGIVSLIEEEHRGKEDQIFLFLVKVYYTIILSRINTLYERFDKNLFWFDNNGKWMNSLFAYRCLIGGNFINSNLIETIAPESKSKVKRSFRLIDLDKLRTVIKEMVSGNDINKLHIVEIVVLCLGRNYEPRYDAVFRKRGDSEYNSDLQRIKRAYFDVNSYMYNVLDLDASYERIGKDFHEYVKDNSKSLYNQLRDKQNEASFSFKKVLIEDSESLISLTKLLGNYRNRTGGFVYNLWYFFHRMSIGIDYTIADTDDKISIIGASKVASVLDTLKNNVEIEEFSQRILSSSEDDRIISIKRLTILKKDEETYKSSQIKYSIIKKYPFFKKDENKKILDKWFLPRKRYSKAKIEEIISEYNKSIQP